VFHVTVNATVEGQQKTASIAITVTDKPKPRLTVTTKPGGKVTGAHGLINCPPACAANFEPGTRVTLTAEPATDNRFEGWGGVCSGTDDCEVTMDKDKTASADFYDFTTPVIITMKIVGSGTVDYAGKTCPSTCAVQVNPGQNVHVDATPAAGFEFVSWTPAGTCSTDTGASCITRAEKSKTMTATFRALPKFSLTITITGQPGDAVTTSDGKSCAAKCTFQYDRNTNVTLTPRAGSMSDLMDSWGGACASTSFEQPCRLTMNSNKSATASFRQTH
jgi:hypothetical protein